MRGEAKLFAALLALAAPIAAAQDPEVALAKLTPHKTN